MRKYVFAALAAALALLSMLWPAAAQSNNILIVASCGNQTLQPGITYMGILTVDTSGKLCIGGSFSATVSGFTPSLAYANLTATNASASVALPANTGTVGIQNAGTTTVSCTLGVGSATATANQILVPPSSTVFVGVGTNTWGACIDQTGSVSNNIVLMGGAGLGTGFGGGGGGGGGGGAVTIADGANVVEGATTDAAATVGGAGTLSAKARLTTTLLNTINTTLGAPFQAGGSIGNTAFGISGTVPNPTTAASWGLLAQGSTTSGQLGGLMMGAVVTSPPTYTNGQTSPATLDAAGNLRVNVVAGGAGGGAVFGPTANGSAAANPPVVIGGTANGAGTGTVQNWKVDSSGTGYVDCVAGGTLCTALANGVQTAGSAVGTQLIAWGINVGGNARQPTGSNPTGTFYAVHHDQIAINGVTVSTGNGVAGTGVQRVAIASDNSPFSIKQTDGTNTAQIDPCEANVQTSTPISITTATTTRIIAPTAAKKTYICYLLLTSAAADNVAIVEGTGGTCGTGTAGIVGGTTAANGLNFAANGGVSMTAGGKTAVAVTAGTNVDTCLITSAATPLAGVVKWVQQ